MARVRPQPAGRHRGSIDVLRSGALRVRVYAGQDPVTGRRHDLVEVVPAGPDAEKRARAIRDRMVRDIEERKHPRTSATVSHLLEKHLEQFAGAPNTLQLYRGLVRKHIEPILGRLKVGALAPEILDSFYTELRRCRDHCRSATVIDHRTDEDHECGGRCRPHRCKPLADTTIRHVHFVLSGAYKRAVRWRWVGTNPMSQAEPPPMPKPNPQPPSTEQAAVILNKAWEDPDWAALLWLAMTSGARRGELCAIRWSWISFEPERETLWLRRAIRKCEGGWEEGDLKTHQQRRIALDAETVAILGEVRERSLSRARALGTDPSDEAYVFSSSADGSTFLTPASVTARYDRLATKLGISTTFHKLRHYSATELIIAGVDPRTVAGRLGHGGGGTTTLKTYTAWVSEADQRAARGLSARMPGRPGPVVDGGRPREQRHPYEVVAARIIEMIRSGTLATGGPLPGGADIAEEFAVSLSTARRATSVLKAQGWVIRSAGRLAVATVAPLSATDPPPTDDAPPAPVTVGDDAPAANASDGADVGYWRATVRGPHGYRSRERIVRGSLRCPDSFREHLLGIARIEHPEVGDLEASLTQYELELRPIDAGADDGVILRW